MALLEPEARKILGRPLTDSERELFIKYVNMLVKWQKTQRLIGSDDPRWIVEHIIVDSLLFAPIIPETAVTALDLGSGAGVPGIPLKIVCPRLQVTLAESRQRRVSFLRTVIRELGLHDVDVRAERMDPHTAHPAFDVVVARCAGPVDEVLRLAAAFLEPGGTAIASGPPERHPLTAGEWMDVKSAGRSRRLFAVYRRQRST